MPGRARPVAALATALLVPAAILAVAGPGRSPQAAAWPTAGLVVLAIAWLAGLLALCPGQAEPVSSDCRTVDARAYPTRTCPAGTVPTVGGRGSSVQAEPGLRSGGTGTLGAFARWGTSRNRAVWYWAATLPRLGRQGDTAGTTHDDIGQSLASTRMKSSSPTRRSFHGRVSLVHLFAPFSRIQVPPLPSAHRG
jgi:hypothetical protein